LQPINVILITYSHRSSGIIIRLVGYRFAI